ncbi:hypothetical protein ACFCYI_11795 [Streptomyces sp. NPDC056257]|uniref:hypothetical protein n=1 Tax=Streptomyces sp. NPDC056257 TaxID=3345765 RepID=UPI0035D6A64F
MTTLPPELYPRRSSRPAKIKNSYVRARSLGGPEADPLTRAVAALGLPADRVASVESAITRAAGPRRTPDHPAARHALRPADAERP